MFCQEYSATEYLRCWGDHHWFSLGQNYQISLKSIQHASFFICKDVLKLKPRAGEKAQQLGLLVGPTEEDTQIQSPSAPGGLQPFLTTVSQDPT